MTIQDNIHEPSPLPPLRGGKWRVRIVSIVSIGVLVALIATQKLPMGWGFAGIVAVAAATWLESVLARHGIGRGIFVEQAASQSAATLLQGLISALPDPTIALDAEGRVVAFNAPASAIAPALRHGDLASIALRVPDVVDAIHRTMATGKPERVEFAERVPSDRWSEAFVMPVQPPAQAQEALGAALGQRSPLLLLTFHDLTQIRLVEEMRVDFVANASHELRTPLAALSGFIETLKGPARDDAPARARFLDIMEAQALRMARLIDDLLSLSRIELAAHVRPVTPIELVSVVRQVVDALQTLARDRSVEVSVHAPAQQLVVAGDRDELIRVFENLIENALKYGASGKRVDITLSGAKAADGRQDAVAAVRDYGPGIAAEHIPRLTERFYRVDVAGSRALGGTGLGLALVKHILNRHRGKLLIDSRAGDGATFTVRLPMTEKLPNAGKPLKMLS